MRLALAACMLGALTACRTTPVGPYQPPTEVVRSTVEAERLTHLAGDLADADPEEAEKLLREALTADLYHGPAHNNLGVLFLKQEKLYEASLEFEWARKLMPGHPDPRVNLAITLERAGKLSEAFETYETALELAPEHLPAIQGAALLAVRTKREEARLAGWLDAIAMRADSETWRTWARSRKGIGS